MGKGKKKGGDGDKAPPSAPGPSRKEGGQPSGHAAGPSGDGRSGSQRPQQQPPRQQQASQQSSAREIEIQVPGNKVALVIGKAGATIKQLQSETKTKMWIIQDSRSADSTSKPLKIAGDPKDVAEARRRVMDIIGEQSEGPPAQQQQRPQQGPPAQQQQRPPPGPPAQQQQKPAWGQPAQQQRPQQGPPAQQGPPVQQQQRPQQGPPAQQQQRPQQGPPAQQQQRPQQGPPGQQQQRPKQGPPAQQPQRPQQGPPAQQQQRPQQGPPAQQQQGPRQGPQAKSQGPSPEPPGITSQLEQMALSSPAPSGPPSQQQEQPRPPPEKSSSRTTLNLGLPKGATGRDYPAINGYMPPKRGDRPAMPKTGRKMIVETNHLPLAISDPKKTIYHYDVKVDPERPFKFYRPALQRVREILYPSNYPSFDGKKNLYSSRLLPFKNDSATVTVQVNDDERASVKDITVTITLASEVSLASIGEYLRSGTSIRPPQDAIQALDIALRQPAAHRYLQVGRSYFTQPSGSIVQLGDGLNLWYGFFQSAILGWKPYLNIDVAHKGFPAAVNCVAALEEILGGQLRPSDTVTGFVLQKMRTLIKGLKVLYAMPSGQHRRTHKVMDLGQSARDTRFQTEDRGHMTVEQYFKETYNYNIRFPLIPCLVCGSQNRSFSLPAELCTIVEGQIVMRKLNENQTRSMVRAAATPAPERKKKIIDSMIGVRFDSDPHIKEFGLSIAKEFKKVEARVLNAPSVHYSNRKSVQVNKGVWNSASFIKPGNLDNWVIYCCERRVRPNEVSTLERDLINIGKTLGMQVSQARIMNLKSDNVRELERDFVSFQKEKVQLLFVILPDRGNVTYAKIKSVAEINVGVLTQCLKSRTVSRLSPATVTNILLKVNAKINGINHNIDPAFWPSFLQRPVMVVGADVTHPSPDQQDIPSVAAVAASHDANAFHYNMKWRLQQPREEMIQDLEQIMKEQLLFFYKRTGLKPERILFYRDGVSEGQFKKVLDIELQAIRRACKSIGDNYEPPITFLVVQKRHHTRFFPTNPRDADGRNQNVPAGTIVDTEIVHPTEFDFYLVSHASIQGTSRPTKYHVLWDDVKMPEQLLEEITYYLCHLFTRCTRAVSYPAPTYYAHLAAFRIRSYIENQDIHLRNLSQEERNRAVKQEIVNNNPMFFV